MAGLHICQVNVHGSDARGEFVEVANNGSMPLAVTGLKITDYTATQQNVHIFTFPAALGGGPLMLGARASAYVFTGRGADERTADDHLLLFAGRDAPMWNNGGDVAYLRNPDGTFIDHMTVGDPKRHPGGH